MWVLDMEVDKVVQSGGWWMCKIYELYWSFCIALLIYLYCFCLSIDNRLLEVRVRSEEKWRKMLSCWICVCVIHIVYCTYLPFNWLRAKEAIEVKRSEEKWREVMTCDVSPVAMFYFSLSFLHQSSGLLKQKLFALLIWPAILFQVQWCVSQKIFSFFMFWHFIYFIWSIGKSTQLISLCFK
jgi:hypothetical protein